MRIPPCREPCQAMTSGSPRPPFPGMVTATFPSSRPAICFPQATVPQAPSQVNVGDRVRAVQPRFAPRVEDHNLAFAAEQVAGKDDPGRHGAGDLCCRAVRAQLDDPSHPGASMVNARVLRGIIPTLLGSYELTLTSCRGRDLPPYAAVPRLTGAMIKSRSFAHARAARSLRMTALRSCLSKRSGG